MTAQAKLNALPTSPAAEPSEAEHPRPQIGDHLMTRWLVLALLLVLALVAPSWAQPTVAWFIVPYDVSLRHGRVVRVCAMARFIPTIPNANGDVWDEAEILGNHTLVKVVATPATVTRRLVLALALVLALGQPAWAQFPTTGVLDNFNRANENPLGNGTWTNPWATGDGNLRILSNVVAVVSGGFSDAYWSAASFGPDAEAFVTITTLGVTNDVYYLGVRATTGSVNGYELDVTHPNT